MLGIRGYTFVRQQLVPGGVEFYIAASPSQLVCPCCKSSNVIGKGGKVRRFRSLPFGRKHVTIVLWIPRVYSHLLGGEAEQSLESLGSSRDFRIHMSGYVPRIRLHPLFAAF